MARRNKGQAALIGLLLFVGGPIWLFANHPVLAIVLVVCVIAGLIVYSFSRSCGVCGVALKRVAYRWEIDGISRRVCPNCNRTFEKRQSSRAINSL